LHPPQRFYVTFHDIAGLNNNAPVNINGVRIGTVEKIELVKKGFVKVHLKINTEDVQVPHNCTFTIQTLGLVGAKYMEITLPDVSNTDYLTDSDADIQTGQDPVRTELLVNKMATNIGKIDFSKIADNMNANMERVAAAADTIGATSKKFGDAAADAKSAAHKADEFFGRGRSSFDSVDRLANGWRSNSDTTFKNISTMSQSWTTTSKKLNKILDNPQLSSDLKETAAKAKETADTIQVAMHELNTTLGDKGTRTDVLSMLDKLNASTENIYKSVQDIHKISGDTGVRDDLKVMLSDARDAMDHVDKIFADKEFKTNFLDTSVKVRTAATQVDKAAAQLSQVLDQKRPLFKMMFGRPGHLKNPDTAPEPPKQGNHKAKTSTQDSPSDIANKSNQDAATDQAVPVDPSKEAASQAPVPQAPVPQAPVLREPLK
jgi:phospholipid/cholesterol/gamma-HCH transport system substrate-binding protein